MLKNLAVSLLLTAALFGQKPSSDPKAEQAVKAAMDQFAKAVLTKDKATLEKLMGDSILYSHSNANLDTKESFIKNVMSENPKYEGFDYGESKTVIYGNTAIVRGKITVKDLLEGKRRTIELNVMQVWLKNGSGWTLVGRQSMRLNP